MVSDKHNEPQINIMEHHHLFSCICTFILEVMDYTRLLDDNDFKTQKKGYQPRVRAQ